MSMVVVGEQKLGELRNENKWLPEDWRTAFQLKPKRNSAFNEAQLEVMGEKGHTFKLIATRSTRDPTDFSVIMLYLDKRTGEKLILVRHNGDHKHTNMIEGDHLKGCHIHMATQRYQERGLRADAYATKTEEYSSFGTALDSMINKYNFKVPGRPKIDDTSRW